MASNTAVNSEDPCGEFGPVQRWALVWFVLAIAVGITMTIVLSRVDRFNYDTKGVYLDYNKYRENRLSTTTIGSERNDPRANPLLSSKVGQ